MADAESGGQVAGAAAAGEGQAQDKAQAEAKPIFSPDANVTSGDAYVEFEGVHKTFDGVTPIVRDLDLTVYEGEFLTLLGPSGSGKTTCLMMLAGFEVPSAGRIRIDGRAVDDVPARKRNIGMVFQNYALFPHMTVGANLAFPLQVRGMDKTAVAERVNRALRLVRLEGFEGRRPGQLSGGQQQRVAIARALVFEPRLVLMDEPLGALDRRLREEMQFEIRRIQRTLGVTVVYVTHDQQEAMAMSDRVAVFNAGRIEQIASPEVLYEEPRRPFVASFIGDNNLLHGRVTAVNGDTCDVQVGDFSVNAFMVTLHAVGDDVVLAVRPERTGIVAETGMYTNEFEVRVEDMAFLGDHLRVLTNIGGDPFVVKIPNIVGHGGVLAGEYVRIGWATLDCRAMRPTEGDGAP